MFSRARLRMGAIFAVSWVSGAALQAAPPSTPPAAASGVPGYAQNIDNIDLFVPDGLTLNHKVGPDFEVLSLQKGEKFLVTIYVGNWPSFPRDKKKAGTVVAKTTPERIEKSVQWGTPEKQSGETLVSLLPVKRVERPEFLHFMYQDLSPEEFKLVQAAIERTKPHPREVRKPTTVKPAVGKPPVPVKAPTKPAG